MANGSRLRGGHGVLHRAWCARPLVGRLRRLVHRRVERTYIQLTEAEAAFRVHKSDLSIRPIWHHREDRVRAHILVCFLAYVLWKTLEQWQARAGLGHSPRTILEELHRIQSTDVILPTADGRELRLRCVIRPEPAQAHLLARLGLDLPERLRIRPPLLLTARNVVPTFSLSARFFVVDLSEVRKLG